MNFFANHAARFNRFLAHFISYHFFGIYFLFKNTAKNSALALHLESTYLKPTYPNGGFSLQSHMQAFITDASFQQRYGYVGGYAGQPSATKPLRVMMLGLRGFPDVQGGIETHAEHLAPLLVSLGCDLEVLVRSSYQQSSTGKTWCGVRFTQLWAPDSKAFEAILHTFLGVLYAAIKRPDILHIHAVGPALLTPLARVLGLRVVVTHHGPDYNRQKWGYIARHVLLLGEWAGMRFSNARIVISNGIRETVSRKHAMQADLIHNGVVLPNLDVSDDYLTQFGLQKNRYILLVSRLVPEKRHLDLIQAFNEANLDGYKLALVGQSDHPDAYLQSLQDAAKANPNIILTGFQKGDTLRSLYTHAAMFVLPSSHEGLSISLLEALSFGLPVIASDIPANIEVGLKAECYFELGNVQKIKQLMLQHTAQTVLPEAKMHARAWINSHYNWKNIAEKTINAYHAAF